MKADDQAIYIQSKAVWAIHGNKLHPTSIARTRPPMQVRALAQRSRCDPPLHRAWGCAGASGFFAAAGFACIVLGLRGGTLGSFKDHPEAVEETRRSSRFDHPGNTGDPELRGGDGEAGQHLWEGVKRKMGGGLDGSCGGSFLEKHFGPLSSPDPGGFGAFFWSTMSAFLGTHRWISSTRLTKSGRFLFVWGVFLVLVKTPDL